MLYPNFYQWSSLSTNHVEIGVHNKQVSTQNIQNQFTLPLLDFNRTGIESILDLPHRRLPIWEKLPILDLWGNVTTEEEIVTRGSSAINALGSCLPSPRISVRATYDARDLLCPKRRYQAPGMVDEMALPEGESVEDGDLDFEVEIAEESTITEVLSAVIESNSIGTSVVPSPLDQSDVR
jgi:hypothetical protein